MRVREAACALPLLLSLGCESVASDDVGESALSDSESEEKSLEFKKTPNYQKLYDRYEGKYDVDSFTGTIARTGGIAGDPISADFYYPDGCDGDRINSNADRKWKVCNDKLRRTRAAFADAFPVVPLLQGGNVPRSEYSLFAAELASFGFVVVVPDLKQAFGPPGSPELFFTSQWVPNWVATDIAQRDADALSPLNGIVDSGSMGVVGHSFGAAAALASVQGTCQPPFCFGPPFAYQRPASLKAAVVHGFQNCDPTSGQCFYPNTSAAPSMIVNGGLDDPGAPTSTAYESLEPARGLVVIDHANHFGLTNNDLASPTGPNPEPNELEQEESISSTARWTALWLSAHLLGDSVATTLVFESGGVEGATVTSEM